MIITHPACSCIGHRMPDVFHVIACCDQPHIDGDVASFTPLCEYEYEIWDTCDDEAVGYFQSNGWAGWLCRAHAGAYGVGQ